MKAPIVVLEGLDACGKSTQTELLLKNLEDKNLKVAWKRFPGYTITNAGRRLAGYLRGELGEMEDLSPEMIAALYASDRLAQLDEIEEMRDNNDLVVLDRGVISNIIYAAARASKKSQREALTAYVEKLEYDVFGFPKESMIIFLDASVEARAKIHGAKNRLPDIHEANEDYLKKVREMAMFLSEKDFRWTIIPVDVFGELRRREEIGEEILNLILEKLQMVD